MLCFSDADVEESLREKGSRIYTAELVLAPQSSQVLLGTSSIGIVRMHPVTGNKEQTVTPCLSQKSRR